MWHLCIMTKVCCTYLRIGQCTIQSIIISPLVFLRCHLADTFCDWLIVPPTGSSRGARWPSGLERWLGMATGHSRPGSNPTSVKTFRFGTLAIPFTHLCQCLSDETLKAVGPFYLVSMPGEVKEPTSPHWNE